MNASARTRSGTRRPGSPAPPHPRSLPRRLSASSSPTDSSEGPEETLRWVPRAETRASDAAEPPARQRRTACVPEDVPITAVHACFACSAWEPREGCRQQYSRGELFEEEWNKTWLRLLQKQGPSPIPPNGEDVGGISERKPEGHAMPFQTRRRKPARFQRLHRTGEMGFSFSPRSVFDQASQRCSCIIKANGALHEMLMDTEFA